MSFMTKHDKIGLLDCANSEISVFEEMFKQFGKGRVRQCKLLLETARACLELSKIK